MLVSRDRLVATVVAGALLLVGWSVVSTSTAAAASRDPDCAEAIIDDWYGNGRVDGTYPKRCYREAIASLRNDTKDYTHASEDILRALTYRKRGQPDPGNGASLAAATRAGDGSSSSSHPPGLPPNAEQTDDGAESAAAGGDELGSSSAASVPIPLLVLGGLSLLLLTAGGAGYVSRRLEARRSDDHGS